MPVSIRGYVAICAIVLFAWSAACNDMNESSSSPQESHPQALGEERPTAEQRPGPKPSIIFAEKRLYQAPRIHHSDLAGSVAKFIDWASQSVPEEREYGREMIHAMFRDPEVISVLQDELQNSVETDHTRALVVLAIMGEARTEKGFEFLVEFANRPLPRDGTVVDGEIEERSALAMLQAKAVNGIAYMQTEEADWRTLEFAANHESIIVRSEAIFSLLANSPDPDLARMRLKEHLRAEDQIHLLRVHRTADDDEESFNKKLNVFLKANKWEAKVPEHDDEDHGQDGPNPELPDAPEF